MSFITHTLPPHMDRVLVEREELNERMGLLHDLLTDQPRIDRLKIDKAEIARLRRQYTLMGLYKDTLTERLEASI